MQAGSGSDLALTKLVTFPAADNGLCFLTLSVNLSKPTDVKRLLVKLETPRKPIFTQVDWRLWPPSD